MSCFASPLWRLSGAEAEFRAVTTGFLLCSDTSTHSAEDVLSYHANQSHPAEAQKKKTIALLPV